MKNIIRVLALLLLGATAVSAQCTGSGTVGSCTASSTLAQINAEINTLSDGATLTLAAGTYSIPHAGGGAAILLNATKGITVICATASQAIGAANVNPCILQAQAGTPGLTPCGPAIGSDRFAGTNTHFYRISGFVLDCAGLNPGIGYIYWDSYNGSGNATLTQIRVDHNTFQNFGNGSQSSIVGSAYTSIMSVYGVYDHNLYTGPTQFSMIIWAMPINPVPVTGNLGTSKNLFFEDNVLAFTTVGNASAEGCTDGWGGAAYVLRHNTSTNCLWATHGVTHGGGPSNVEFYNNHVSMTDTTAGTGDCYRCFHHQGSGTILAFNNEFTQASGQGHSSEVISVLNYRDYSGDKVNITGLTSVAVSGTTVTFTGPSINSCCSNFFEFHGFANAGNNASLHITSSAATTMFGTTVTNTQVNENNANGQATNSSIDGSIFQCDGTITNFPYGGVLVSDGNRSPLTTNRGYPCWHQPGRDVNGAYKPMYAWGNFWTDTHTQVAFTFPTATAAYTYKSNHMQPNREWFDATSALANGSGGTFTGASGMGFGPIANRPTTCTTSTESGLGAGDAGVGYAAGTTLGTIGASATGVPGDYVLYTCTVTGNPGTWAVYYTPYTYPHPLVTPVVQPVAPPQNLQIQVN